MCGLSLQAPQLLPALPDFAISPCFDQVEGKGEDVSDGLFPEVFAMPAPDKKPAWALGSRGKLIAAGLVVGAMWLGTGIVRFSRQSSVQDVASSQAKSSPVSADVRQTGPVAWARKVLTDRSRYQVEENFQGGMQAWGTARNTLPTGWQRNRDGYVRPADLALFGPSLKLTDYRFEFFGQIEQKGMGWVVRAKDPQNYYAMKFKVVEAGLRPMISVVHYPVVNGKPGHRVETPLTVMVHNNRPFQVAVNVKGSRFSASIEGEEVDSWSDDALPTGGVGFFAEAGENVRLYWMKVTRHNDWLGRVCGALAGSDNGTETTSELWGSGFGDSPSGGLPRPASPDGPANVTLAAAGLGLPGFRKRRDSKYGRY